MLFHPELAGSHSTLSRLRAEVCRQPGQTASWLLRRPEEERRRVEAYRNVLTYSWYLSRRGQSQYYRRRWEQYLPRSMRRLLFVPGARRVLATNAVRSRTRRFERNTPADPGIASYLRETRPDAVIATPLNYWGSDEVEYVKAARELGIPSALPVFSWDNLTTKSLLYEVPDLVMVWNQKQVEEATEIHGVPRERVVVTGAPHFDEIISCGGWGSGREAFCMAAGLDPARPYILYLGSSAFIASDETWMVREIASALRTHASPSVRDVQVLVRPHPAHAEIYAPLEGEGIRVFPRGGAKLAAPEFAADFHDSLLHAEMAIGINTSGMFNAVVLDKPCATVITPRYSETQEEAMHFQHLIEAGVLDVTEGPGACAGAVGRILEGRDDKREQRRRFVEGWIRPRGVVRPAGQIVAFAVELLAKGLSPPEIDFAIDALQRADESESEVPQTIQRGA